MAQQIDYDYTVTQAQAEHFDNLRQARGWSWTDLADNLERAHPEHDDPATPGLVAWARANAAEDKSARAKKGTERATKAPGEKR